MVGGESPRQRGGTLPHHVIKIKLGTQSRLYYESVGRFVMGSRKILGVRHGAHRHHVGKLWVKLISSFVNKLKYFE